jgi:hypothetical protein
MVNEVQSDAPRALDRRGKCGRERSTAHDERARDAMFHGADRVCVGIASAH